MHVDPQNSVIAAYIDRKADVARRYASRHKDVEIHQQVARVLDALADEIRMGLYRVEPQERA